MCIFLKNGSVHQGVVPVQPNKHATFDHSTCLTGKAMVHNMYVKHEREIKYLHTWELRNMRNLTLDRTDWWVIKAFITHYIDKNNKLSHLEDVKFFILQ